MLVQSFLVQGSGVGGGLASRISYLLSSSQPPLDALVLFSLGADHSTLLQSLDSVVTTSTTTTYCPCYLTETYGILGFDDEEGRNVELMEKGRGSEYGYSGGLGGQGCLVVGYQGVVAGHSIIDDIPTEASSLMVVADSTSQWKTEAKSAANTAVNLPLQYGGISKSCWRVVHDALSPTWEPVPYFWVADVTADKSPTGVTTFADDEDGKEATQRLLQKLPAGFTAATTSSVGLFPCFTRGINHYGLENVEPDAVASVLQQQQQQQPSTLETTPTVPRIYGMFAHGELGPTAGYCDFPIGPPSSSSSVPCTQHSMTSILAVHTTQKLN